MEINDGLMLPEPMIDIRPRLRARIDDLGLAQAEVARRAGITPQRLNNYLQRGVQPDIETAARLAGAVQVSVDWLLGLNAAGPVEIAPIVARLLELDGMLPERASAIADAVREAVRIATALPDEGDAVLRSRMAAQTVWQSRVGSRLS